MEHPPRLEPPDERIGQAMERLNAALARICQAQDVLAEAKERLALARRALEDTTARDATAPPSDNTAERTECEEDDSGTARSAGGVSDATGAGDWGQTRKRRGMGGGHG